MLWTNWQRFAEMTSNPAPSRKGVYQIRATAENGTPKTIRRACEDDSDGILYIGEGNLCGRIGYLLEIVREDCEPKGHRKSFTPSFARYGLKRICDRRLLEVRWMECENCKAEEKQLLEAYKVRTGDIPPANLRLC